MAGGQAAAAGGFGFTVVVVVILDSVSAPQQQQQQLGAKRALAFYSDDIHSLNKVSNHPERSGVQVVS